MHLFLFKFNAWVPISVPKGKSSLNRVSFIVRICIKNKTWGGFDGRLENIRRLYG